MKTLGLIFALLCLAAVYADSPDLVIEIFRHGIRTPETPKYDSSWDDYGYGELTPAGMRQQYMLGAILKETYPDLLIPYKPSKIYVQATQENRTIVSALSQLYGIYNGIGPNLTDDYPVDLAVPPYNHTEVQAIVNNLVNTSAAIPDSYYPIPVHSLPRASDIFLQSYLNCPSANAYYYQQMNDSTVQAVYAELNDTIANLTALGLDIEDEDDFDDLGDTVLGDYYNQVPLPGNISATSQEFKDLIFFTQWYEIYPTLGMDIQKKLFAGPFLHHVLDFFNQNRNNTLALDFAFFAAKETMMSSLLSALGIMTPQCLLENWQSQRANGTKPHPLCDYPNFAANLIFEYYNTSTPYVQVKYDGQVMNLCNNKSTCTLDDFTAFINNVTDGIDITAFQQQCKIATNTSTTTQRTQIPHQ